MKTPPWIDGSLYPDTPPPEKLMTMADRVDFLVRLCAAWDFGILPYAETLAEVRQFAWREVVDQCRLLTSPTYHLLRSWHDLPSLPYLGQKFAYILDDPNLAYI